MSNEVAYPNGFPAYYRELPKEERLHKCLGWWIGVHVGNTGFTESNVDMIEKEIKDIFLDKKDNDSSIENKDAQKESV